MLSEKLNEGDAMEGIFAIAIATYLRDGEYNQREINKYRAKIEPDLFNDGTVIFDFDPVYDNLPGKPRDTFNVKLEIRLKPSSVKGAFGKDAQALFTKASDIGKLDIKTKSMIKYIKNTSAQRKIDRFVDDLLKNNTKDEVDLHVLADGIAGESSGGIIKGDVALKIKARIGGRRAKQLDLGEVNFSLKSDSVTLANLAPFQSMDTLASYFKVPFSPSDVPDDLRKIVTSDARTPAHKKQKVSSMRKIFELLKKKMAGSNQRQLRVRAFNLLKLAAFGSDAADVINLSPSKISEITVENIKKLEADKNIQFELNFTDNAIEVLDKKTGNKLWHLRTKFRSTSSGGLELKMMFEVGHMVYDPPTKRE
tara:strand:- start:2382 stop:3479 length:1098 start_codon:yes stop_codon:yes gene_type:complete